MPITLHYNSHEVIVINNHYSYYNKYVSRLIYEISFLTELINIFIYPYF